MIQAQNVDLVDVRKQLIRETQTIADASLGLNATVQGDADHLVTSLDEHIHTRLCETLPSILDVDILSEEQAATSVTSDLIWIIDPIDGTANAAVGNGDYAISVALYSQVEDCSLAGIVHLPAFNTTFSASANEGAYRNKSLLRVENKHKAPSIMAIGVPANASNRVDLFLDRYRRFLQSDIYMRQSGSAAIDVCRVAESQWTGFHQYGVKIWDIAAADLIAREAGCLTYQRPTPTDGDSVHDLDYLAISPYNKFDLESLLNY